MVEGIIEFEVPQIRGLLPALDPKQVNTPFVIEGQNFIVDAEGPASYFGGYNYNPHEVDFGDFPQTFRMNETWVVAGSRGIWSFDATEKRFYPMLIVNAPAEPWPWTMTKIGLKFYWARYGENLWQYDPATNIWQEITTAVPAGVRGCCASYGRLIVIGNDSVAWSQLDDGSNFVTNVQLGIGAQSLGIAGGDTPFGVYPVSNGFVCFLRNGMMKSQYTGAANPFFHQPIETEVSALSPFAIVKIDKGPIIFISTNGLWQMTESLPQPYQPLFSQYLVRKRFQQSAFEKSGVYMLSYLPRSQYLVLGISTTDVALKFDEGYVLYIPRDEWGSYNRTFKNFGELPDAFSGTGLIAPVLFNVNDRFIKQVVDFNAAERDIDYGQSLCFKGTATPELARTQNNEVIFSAGMNLYGIFYKEILNELSRSEEFDHSDWSKLRSSITPNAIADPNGDVTADKIIENTDTNTHIVAQLPLTVNAGETFTVSVHAKAAERFRFRMNLPDTWWAVNSHAQFDLIAGTAVTLYGSATIIDVGGGWYRCSYTLTSIASGNLQFIIEMENDFGIRNYTGDGISGFYIWGAQVEKGADLSSYVKTVAVPAVGYEITKKPSDLVNIGAYADDPDLNPAARILGNLDSYVIVGLFRGRDQNFGDSLNVFTAVEISSLPSGTLAAFEDWLLIADGVDDQDWNILSGFEDWGDNPAGLNNYEATFETTFDGVNVAQSELMDVYLEEDNIRFYRPTLEGKYGRICVKTADATQSFHLKFLDVSANLGGRIG